MDEYERLKAQKEEMLKRHESAKDKRIAELEVDIEGRSMIEQGLKERIRDLEYSIANHFTNEHLAGKGPEIDRWKRKVKELESELAAASEAFAEQDIKRHNEAVHLRDVISALEHEIVAKDARIRELEDGLVMEQTLHMLDHAALDALKAQVDREAK